MKSHRKHECLKTDEPAPNIITHLLFGIAHRNSGQLVSHENFLRRSKAALGRKCSRSRLTCLRRKISIGLCVRAPRDAPQDRAMKNER